MFKIVVLNPNSWVSVTRSCIRAILFLARKSGHHSDWSGPVNWALCECRHGVEKDIRMKLNITIRGNAEALQQAVHHDIAAGPYSRPETSAVIAKFLVNTLPGYMTGSMIRGDGTLIKGV